MNETARSTTAREATADVDALATDHVLAIDLGTGGPKVGFVSLRGVVAWHGFEAVETRHSDDGGAVQDADAWWRAVIRLTRQGLAAGVVAADRVVAVSVTGQYASTVPVDAAGVPVGDCLLWMDSRGGPLARRRFGGIAAGYDPRTITRWVRRTGGAPSLSGADPIGQRLFLHASLPDVAAAARWMLEPIDQLTMRFTGVAQATPASMATAWLIDTNDLDRLCYDDALVRAAGIDPAQLPPLVPSGSVVGQVTADVADVLGLTGEVPVIAALPDLHTGMIGSGAVAQYRAHLALSTSSWISCPVPRKKTDVFHQIATVPGVGRHDHLVIDNHEVGGLALTWLRDGLLADGDATPSYDELTALAATAEPGCGGMLFSPWLNGERSPVDDRRARGGFHNVSLRSGRAEFVRAVLEGVAFNSRWLHDYVEGFTSTRLDPIRIIGGGAQSDLWCQIHADVLDRTIDRPADPIRANLRGAALHAAVALGRIELADVPGLVPLDATFVPNPAHRATYDGLYREFTKLYRTQKRMFRRLNTP